MALDKKSGVANPFGLCVGIVLTVRQIVKGWVAGVRVGRGGELMGALHERSFLSSMLVIEALH